MKVGDWRSVPLVLKVMVGPRVFKVERVDLAPLKSRVVFLTICDLFNIYHWFGIGSQWLILIILDSIMNCSL